MSTARNLETLAKFRKLLARDRRMVLKFMEDQPLINRETID